MQPRDDSDSLFSAGKPKKISWVFYPFVIAMITAMVIFFNSV
jgi:hypothetical protein